MNKSIFSNKIVMILLSAVLAFSLWLYVITVVSPNSETTIYDIPVSFEGDSVLEKNNNLIITSKVATKVDLRIAGNRTDLNKLNSSNIKIKADVTKIYDPGTHDLTYTVILPGDIPTNAVSIQSKSPSTVRVVVEQRLEKEIPVNVVYTNTTPDPFVKEQEQLDKQTVIIAGPAGVVEDITQAVVEIDLKDQRDTIVETKTIRFCDEEGNPVENELVRTTDNQYEVTVTVPIVMLKEIPLKLNVIPGGGATEQTAGIEMSHTMLSISGPEAMVSGLKEIVLGTLDLAKIKEPGTVEFEVKLPEGVTNETGVTTVTVNISFAGLATRSFQVTNIRCINVPAGMDVQVSAQQVEVIIRGIEAKLDRLSEEDISVIIDLAEAAQGTEKYTAVIQLPESYAELGAIGTYPVTVTLQPQNP